MYLDKNKQNANLCIFIHILSSHLSKVFKDGTTDLSAQLCHFEEETIFTTRFRNKILKVRLCISLQIVMVCPFFQPRKSLPSK